MKIHAPTTYEIPLRKSAFLSGKWKIAIGKNRVSAKIGFKIGYDQLDI
jgi:hypothetical protein